MLLLILGIIGGLYGGYVTPTEAGAGGAFLAMVIGIGMRELSFAKSIAAMKDAMVTTAQIFFVGMGAAMYTKFLALAGISALFADMMEAGRSIRFCS